MLDHLAPLSGLGTDRQTVVSARREPTGGVEGGTQCRWGLTQRSGQGKQRCGEELSRIGNSGQKGPETGKCSRQVPPQEYQRPWWKQGNQEWEGCMGGSGAGPRSGSRPLRNIHGFCVGWCCRLLWTLGSHSKSRWSVQRHSVLTGTFTPWPRSWDGEDVLGPPPGA